MPGHFSNPGLKIKVSSLPFSAAAACKSAVYTFVPLPSVYYGSLYFASWRLEPLKASKSHKNNPGRKNSGTSLKTMCFFLCRNLGVLLTRPQGGRKELKTLVGVSIRAKSNFLRFALKPAAFFSKNNPPK